MFGQTLPSGQRPTVCLVCLYIEVTGSDKERGGGGRRGMRERKGERGREGSRESGREMEIVGKREPQREVERVRGTGRG